jgi:toxin ParE1/3/4
VTQPVEWHALAKADLFDIYDWIAERADPETAFAYTSRIERRCQALRAFPHRGTPRNELESGLRTITFERRVLIAYRVEKDRVLILRLIRIARDIAAQFAND